MTPGKQNENEVRETDETIQQDADTLLQYLRVRGIRRVLLPRLPVVDEGSLGAKERTKLGVDILVEQCEQTVCSAFRTSVERLKGSTRLTASTD